MRKRELDAIASLRRDEAATLQSRHEIGDAEPAHAIIRERLTDRNELQRRTLAVLQAAHPGPNEVVQAIARFERTAPLPQPMRVLQRARLETLEHDFTQVQRVSA